jgi:ParB-like chromosome segregation protein Spo0J
MKFHPYANLFPLMTKLDLDALAEDIRANGQQQPVIRYQGLILDGRNRYLACEAVGIDPIYREFEGNDEQALALVISLNVQRRDMTAAQRALVAARALPMFEDAADGRKKAGKTIGTNRPKGRARTDAAAVFKVGEKAVQQAKALLTEAADLVEEVEAGTLTLAGAYEELQQRHKEVEQRKRKQRIAAKYAEAIASGEMTLEEALQKVQEEKTDAEQEKQARQLWRSHVSEALGLLERWVGSNSDEDLAWHIDDGASGTDGDVSLDAIDEAVEQLKRVRSVIFTRNS